MKKPEGYEERKPTREEIEKKIGGSGILAELKKAGPDLVNDERMKALIRFLQEGKK